ncbi:phosphoenolpyruvate synthase [Roseofilum casamattae]|uniref:Phosphoenolpyruvate synthase n=1 Tax=Roseofilum casamattae BLCC-M143 TaxID=3022442 RepID=A0ABT7BSK5_9CYAN|nr:phosphoenolpyruvate synthase [Roseofilum casamattae]MDJ1182173.1 phosphoenolpyruvate synthase [Roseofilum casamattae BLCC-M143]
MLKTTNLTHLFPNPSPSQALVLWKENAFVLWLDRLGLDDLPLVGGKNASLGEMLGALSDRGINVPQGFAVTAYAYRCFLRSAGLEAKLGELLDDLDVNNVKQLQQRAEQARALIMQTPLPKEIEIAIAFAYQRMGQIYGGTPDVAVRSSATAEDLPNASFAGQQDTYLNISGLPNLLKAIHRCFASLFTDRAIAYRTHNGFDHLEVALSVGVQKMVRSDKATSGVIFSIDPETGFKNAILITAAYGLGETVVQGAVNPDEYFVFKPTLQHGDRPILQKRLGRKAIKMVYGDRPEETTKIVPVPQIRQQQFALSDDEILQLARWTTIIEHHYSRTRDIYTPMDIEWAKDGETGELFIVQARPETVQSQKSQNVLHHYRLQEPGNLLVSGRAVGEAIATGPVRVILDISQMDSFQPGEVLVTHRTDPDWEPIMKQASAIVTNTGGRTCHAAIIAREMGIPAIVGCEKATEQLHNGDLITVCCAEGEQGNVYAGELPFEIQQTVLEELPKTRTKIMMNVGNPEEAFRLSSIPCDGVGLARLEFIIANRIKIHPLALVHFEELEDPQVKQEIDRLTVGYAYKPDFFVDGLASGMSAIAAAFYPNPVIIRLSDFKSNEYANLLGGRQFEPMEENPMLGWRGASRYYDPKYREAFALECRALKRVRDDMGLINVIPMIPFCRTPEEGNKVLVEMAKHGLKRGQNVLQVYMMCELPSNVLLAKEFAQIFDGFSIGSNDLTQLTLGLDRDSALVSELFDERNAAVKRMVKLAIATLKQQGRKIGICGQAPSDYPEFAQFLVELGIDSMSLNPDSVLKTMLKVSEIEGSDNRLV